MMSIIKLKRNVKNILRRFFSIFTKKQLLALALLISVTSAILGWTIVRNIVIAKAMTEDDLTTISDDYTVDSPKVETVTLEPVVKEIKAEREGRVVKARISFYGAIDNPMQGGAYDSVGKLLEPYDIAVPDDIPIDTKIEINGEIFTARDRGDAIFWEDGVMRIDVFIPRIEGEDDDIYEQRLYEYGVHYIDVKILS